MTTKDLINNIRICKYCGMELSEGIPHGLRECHLRAVARIAELEDQLEDWTNNGWAEDYKARIAELEAENDQLTARWRQERQDDKSPNDTQTQTIVYGKESEE